MTTTLTQPPAPAIGLNVGPADGQNWINVGIGYPKGHKDISLKQLEDGFTDSNYFYTVPNGNTAFRMTVDGAKTSKNTKYPRAEGRETDRDGKAYAWDGRKGVHKMGAVSIIRNVTKLKPWVCFGQAHGPDSDLVRLQTEGADPTHLKLVARNTPPGSKSETVKVVQSYYKLGDAIVWDFTIIDGLGCLYIGGLLVHSFPAGLAGCYWKFGAYLQSNVDTEKGDKKQFALVEVIKGTPYIWHTGRAETGTGVPVEEGPVPVPVPPPSPVPPVKVGTRLYIERHAEKPSDPDDHTLNAAGRARAASWAEFWTRTQLPEDLLPIDECVVSKGQSASMRPFQTMTPWATKTGKTLVVKYDAAHAKDAINAYISKLGVYCFCWAHGEIPDLVAAIKKNAPISPTPPKEWDSKRFDLVWEFVKTDKGWTFNQVPSLTAPGDSAKDM